jgi:hypothetical protein
MDGVRVTPYPVRVGGNVDDVTQQINEIIQSAEQSVITRARAWRDCLAAPEDRTPEVRKKLSKATRELKAAIEFLDALEKGLRGE